MLNFKNLILFEIKALLLLSDYHLYRLNFWQVTYKIDVLLELFHVIPRMVWLDSSGKQVLQWPVEKLETEH